MDAEFPRPRAEQVTLNPDQVAEIEELVKLEVALPHGVQPGVDLQAFPSSRQVRKPRLAVRADGHDAARYPHGNFARSKLFRRERRVFGRDLGNRVRHIILARVSLVAQVNDRLEFFPALLDQVRLFIFCHEGYLLSTESFALQIRRAL